MVMPSSGPISMAQAHAEFGLGYSLSAYYGCDSGVPTSGPISLWHLYGKASGFAFYRMDAVAATGGAGNVGAYEIRFIDVFGNDVSASAIASSAAATGVLGQLTDNVANASNYYFLTGATGGWFKFSAASRKRLSKVRVNCPKGQIISFNLYGANTSAAADSTASMTFIKTLSMTYAQSVAGWNEFVI